MGRSEESRTQEALDALSLVAERPAVVTIDVHRGHLDPEVATLPLPAERSGPLVERINGLVSKFRDAGVPIVHVTTAYRNREEVLSNRYWEVQSGRKDSFRARIAEHNVEPTVGIEFMPGLVDEEKDVVVTTKKRYDCFRGTDLNQVLRAGNHDALLMMGVNTNSCVLATAVSASIQDYAVFVIEDAVDSMLGRELHESALAVLGASFAWVIDGDTAYEAVSSKLKAAA